MLSVNGEGHVPTAPPCQHSVGGHPAAPVHLDRVTAHLTRACGAPCHHLPSRPHLGPQSGCLQLTQKLPTAKVPYLFNHNNSPHISITSTQYHAQFKKELLPLWNQQRVYMHAQYTQNYTLVRMHYTECCMQCTVRT